MNINVRRLALAAALLHGAAGGASAAVRQWTGSGAANTGANWSGGAAPVSGDTVIFSSANINNCTWNITGLTNISLFVHAGYTGTVVFNGSPFTINNFLAVDGGSVLFANPANTYNFTLGLTVRNGADVEIQDGQANFSTPGSSVTVDGSVFRVISGGRVAVDTITVTNGGTFEVSSFGPPSQVSSGTLSNPLSLYIDGTVNISSAVIKNLGPKGLRLGPNHAVSQFDKALFMGPLFPGTTGISIEGGASLSTFTNVKFDAGFVNVAVSTSFAGRVSIYGAQGTRAGPQFESDFFERVDWFGFPLPPPAGLVFQSQAPAFLNASETDRPMVRLGLWSNSGPKFFSGLKVSMNGDLPASLAKARVWKDANANGTLETGTDVFLGEANFVSGSPTSASVSFNDSITASTITVFVALSYQNAPGGKAVVLGVMNGPDFGLYAPPVGPPLPAVSAKSYVRASLTASPISYSTPTAGTSSGGGFDTQLFVNKGQVFHVEAAGNWNHGAGLVGPSGSATSGGLGGGLFIGQLVGRVGSGAWFALNATSTITATQSGNLYVAMSDTSYGDNSGALDVVYYIIPSTSPKRWVGGTAGFPNAAGVDSNWTPAVRPSANEHVVFDAASYDCHWDMSVTLASLQMTTAYTRVLKLTSPTNSKTVLQIGNSTTFRGGTVDIGGHDLVIHGSAVFTDSATLDMGGGGGSVRVGDLTFSNAATLRAVNGSPASLGQAFGSPNWLFDIGPSTMNVTGTGGLNVDARQIRFTGTPTIAAMNRIRMKGLNPNSPALLFQTSGPTTWTFDNWVFDMVSNVNSSATVMGSSITFTNASGPKMGTTKEYDPLNVVFWVPDGGGSPGSLSGNVYGGAISYRILASTSPLGIPTALGGQTSVFGSGSTWTITGLVTPAQYYLFAFEDGFGVPPPPSKDRGGYGHPGSYLAIPVGLGSGSNLSNLDLYAHYTRSVSGNWGMSTTQVGPVRIQLWRGGHPSVVPSAILEGQILANPGSSTFSVFGPDATDYYLLGFVDVNNNGKHDNFEANGFLSPLTIAGSPLTGQNLTISGGFAAPGGTMQISAVNVHPGYVRSDGWDAVTRVGFGAYTSSVVVNSLVMGYQGVVPNYGVYLGLIEDTDGNAQLDLNHDSVVGYSWLPNSSGQFGAYSSTITFNEPTRIDAGTTRYYFLSVDLWGQRDGGAFNIFVASPAAIGIGAGFLGGVGAFPINSGSVTPRLFVPADNQANPDGSGGEWTGSSIFPGQTLTISAAGSWKRSGSDGGVSPAGQPGTTGLNTVLPSAKHGELLVRVERFDSQPEAWFAVGTGTSIVRQAGGDIYFAMNDLVGAYYDNSGYAAVDYQITGSTVGRIEGTVFYTGNEGGNILVYAESGPESASQLIPLVGGTTYYPYVLDRMQTSGGWQLSATIENNTIQQVTRQVPLASGATAYVDLPVPLSSGTITGTLTYSGVMPFGDFIIAAATVTDWTSGHVDIIGQVQQGTQGLYTISDLPTPATYYVVAFRSATGDGGPKHAEPFGYFGTPGSGISQFGTALTPVFVPEGGDILGINFSIFDTGEISGRAALPATPSGANLIVLAGRGVLGSPNFVFENEVRQFVQNPSPSNRAFAVDLLRPATNYVVFGFLDLNFDATAQPNEPAFVTGTPLNVPQGGSTALDFALVSSPVPPAPTGFASSATVSSVSFTWNLSQGATQYELRNAAGGVIATISHPTSSYIDTLAANTSSHIRAITATNVNGTSSSSTLAAVYSLAAAPTAPSVLAVTQTSAQVFWSPNNPAGTVFQLERATVSAGPFVLVQSTTSNGLTDVGLSAARTYHYRLRASNGNGLFSSYTSQISTTTDPASGPNILGLLSYSGLQTGVVRVQASTSAAFAPIASQVTLPRLAQQPYQLPVAGLQTYFLRAFVDVNGDGSPSAGEDRGPAASLSAPVVSSPVTGQDFSIVADTVAPASPAGLTPTPGFRQVRLSWAAPTKSADNGPLNDLLGFILQRSTVAAGPFTAVTPVISTTVFVDTAAVPGVLHYYRVLARDLGRNDSLPSGLVSATPSPGGKISGSLQTYSFETGVYHVRLSTVSYPDAPFLQDSTLPSFTFEGLPDGVYYLTGFQDLDNDNHGDPLSEPAGTHGGISRPYAVTIAGGNNVTGADVVVCEREPIGANQTKSATVNPSDCPARDKSANHYTHLYAFTVGGGGAGSIGVGSEVNLKLISTFENEIILLGPDGSVLARDNRTGGSGVRATLTAPGVYIIEPTAFAPFTVGGLQVTMSVTGGFSGQLSGSVAYGGSRPGKVVVQVMNTPDSSALPVRVSTQAAPGAFSVGGLPDGSYYVRAYRDANNNGARDPGEPSGAFGSEQAPTQILVSGGVANQASVGVTLTDPAAGAVEGVLVYEGSQVGGLRVEIGPRRCPSCNELESVTAFTGTTTGNAYALTFLPPTTNYLLQAYVDSNSNGRADTLEAKASSAPVVVVVGATTTVSMVVRDPGFGSSGNATIVGSVTYNGSQNGPIFVGISRDEDFLAIDYIMNLSTTGAFVKTGLAGDTTYYVGAFMDVNGNANLDHEQGEPVGNAEGGAPIYVSLEGQTTANILLEDPPSGEMRGRITYNGGAPLNQQLLVQGLVMNNAGDNGYRLQTIPRTSSTTYDFALRYLRASSSWSVVGWIDAIPNQRLDPGEPSGYFLRAFCDGFGNCSSAMVKVSSGPGSFPTYNVNLEVRDPSGQGAFGSANTGEIHTEGIYLGVQSGPMLARMFDNENFAGQPLFTQSVAAPAGPTSADFTFRNVPFGQYWIEIFRDITGTGSFNPAVQGRTTMSTEINSSQPSRGTDGPLIVDPGGAGSLNVFTGGFAHAGGARFDGGSSDLGLTIAVDSVTVGGPFVYAAVLTTQLEGGKFWIVKYSSTGVMLANLQYENEGTVPRLQFKDGYLYVFGGTTPYNEETEAVITVYDDGLNFVAENQVVDAAALQGGAFYQGEVFVAAQDPPIAQPDVVKRVDPITGAENAVGTYNFPGSLGDPHADAVVVNQTNGDVFVYLTSGGNDVGGLAGLLKFDYNLGTPQIVKDVTVFQARDAALAISPVDGTVYLGYIDRDQSRAVIRRYDSSLNELGSNSIAVQLSTLVDLVGLAVDEDGDVYVGGTGPSGAGDLLAARFSANLTLKYARLFDGLDGTRSDFGAGLDVHDSSSVFVVGAVNNGVNLDSVVYRFNMNAGGSASGAGQTVVITTANATSAVYGGLQYAGTLASSGTFRSALLPWGSQVPTRNGAVPFAGPRSFLFNNVPPTWYVIRSFLDLNNNLVADAGEPYGFSNSDGFYFEGDTTSVDDVELCDRRQINSGADVFDSLAVTDCVSSDLGSRQRLYTFRGKRGQNVTIGMEALGFHDSFLVLYGPNGDIVAYDDDSWGDGDSIMEEVSLTQDGLYTIAASAYNADAAGAFRLQFDGSAGTLGSIAGVVDYTGSQGGQVFVGLFKSPTFSTTTVFASAVLTSTRNFSFSNLPTLTTYYVGAFIDVNFNRVPDAGEDSGVFGTGGVASPIGLESGQSLQGVRVLVEPSGSAASAGYVTGSVAYAGTRAGSVRLEFWSSASFIGRPAAVRELPAGPGSYDVAVPGGVTYFIKAFLDVDGDFAQDPDEPRGVYSPANEGAQSVFVPVGASVAGVDLTIRDAGTTAGGGVAGEGTAIVTPATAQSGYGAFTATVTYTASGYGVLAGGSVGFGVPPGFAFPQGVTVNSTSTAVLSPVSYSGPSAFVTVSGGALLPGEEVNFVYTANYVPCEQGVKSFQVSSTRDAGSSRQPLILGSPSLTVQPGSAIYFQPVDSYIALESGKRSEAQTLEARDGCGNRAPVPGQRIVEIRAKSYTSGFTFDFDPAFGVSTGAAISTTSAVALTFNGGDSSKTFFALATSTGYKNLELFYNLTFDATAYVGVTVLPAGAISNPSVSTSPAGVGASSTTITPNNDGSADQAFIRFTLADQYLPWHVMLASSPFKAGIVPVWQTWGYGQPTPGAISWDGRYSPWIRGGGRVPNGLYYARIEAAGPGVFNDSLTIGVSVAQLAGKVYDGGFTPNPPLANARIQLYGPSGYNTAAGEASGDYVIPGVAAGVYTLTVQRDDFLTGSLRVTLNAAGLVSTFTATTSGISGSINAAGGLDVIMSRAPALFVVPSLAVGVSTTASDRWGSLQVRSATFSAVQQSQFSPLRLPAGTTTFDDGGQWDQGTQQFVSRTTMKFNVIQGPYVVEARLDGFAPSTAAVVVGAEGATVILPPIAAKSSVAGTITVSANPSGLDVSIDAVPLTTTTVILGNSSRIHLNPGVTTGGYIIGGLDAGSYVVRASASGLVTSATAPISVGVNAQVVGVDPPTLTPGASITGSATVLADTTLFPMMFGGPVFVRMNAWAPGTLSFGSTAFYVQAGVNQSFAYAIPGLNAGTTYLIYASIDTNSDTRFETVQTMPGSTLGNGTFNVSFTPSSGVISGTVLLPGGNTDFINVSVSVRTLASSRPEDIGQSNTDNGAHNFDNFLCVPAGVPAPTGYCPAGSSTGTFKFFGMNTQTVDLTFTYTTTGETRRRRMSVVSGSTSTLFIDLTGETWSVAGSLVNQVANPLFNSNPRVVANAQYVAPPGYPVGLSSSAARVTAVLQDPERFTVALSTAFDPVTSRVGFLAESGTFTIRNVPSGVYYVRTVGLAACTTCEIVVPSVGRIVRVSTNVTGVSLTISDGYSVAGTFSLDGGLQDSGDFEVSILNRRQEVVRSTTVPLGRAALGLTANSASYSFVNLPANEFYTLLVRGVGEAPRYVGRPVRFPNPGLSPTGLQSSLTGQDVSLLRAAYATGRLRDGGTGSLIGAANAALLAPTFEISANANPWVEGGYALAASSMSGRPILGDGTFRVGPLLPNVSYDIRLGQTSWDPAFLQRGSQNYTPAVVSGVTPQPGESKDLGVVSLHQGQSISGVIRSTGTGQALGGIKVVGQPSFGTSGLVAQTYSDQQGRYDLWISTYVSAQYDVTAAPRDGNQASNGLTYGEVIARNVSVSTRTTIDFTLTPLFGAVTGQVVVADAATGGELSYPFGDLRGFPAAAINLQKVGVVALRNPLGDIEERTDANGAFSIRGLSTGTYTMRVTSLGYSVFNATVTKTNAAFQLYTGSNTPSNYLPNNTITLTRGATVTGRILKTDGTAPSASEVASVAAANFGSGEFVVGSVDIDKTAKTVNSYSISGFKPGVAYDLVIVPAGRGQDVSFPPEGRGVVFSASESTTTKNISLTFTPTGIDCRATSRSLGNSQVQVKIDCTKALRNTLPNDNDLDVLLALSTYTTSGAAPVSPNNTGQLLTADKTMSKDRRQLTAIYRAGALETVFSLRLRVSAAEVDPTTGANFSLDKVFDFYMGLDSNVVERITNMSGGSVELQPSALDEQLGLDERGRISLQPGTFAFENGVVVASATIAVGLTKARDRQSASVLAVQRVGFVPMDLQRPERAGALPAELSAAMNTYRTQASTTTVGGANPLSSFYNIFLPAGVRHQLQKAADLTFSYATTTSTTAANNPDRINVWFYNAVLGRFVLENVNRRVDTVNQTITVAVDHFSVFVVLDSTPVIQAPNLIQTDEIQAVNFPNPADCVTHRNLVRNAALFPTGGVVPDFQGTMIRYSLPPGSATEAKINIYNIAGEKVRTIEPGSLSGGVTYYSPWNCANESGKTVSSGVYIGEVKWGGKSKFFKMAIIKGSGL